MIKEILMTIIRILGFGYDAFRKSPIFHSVSTHKRTVCYGPGKSLRKKVKIKPYSRGR